MIVDQLVHCKKNIYKNGKGTSNFPGHYPLYPENTNYNAQLIMQLKKNFWKNQYRKFLHINSRLCPILQTFLRVY